MVTKGGFTWLKLGSSKVLVSLCNVTTTPVTIKDKMVIAELSAANVVPPKHAPRVQNKQTEKMEGTEMCCQIK